MNGPIDPKLVAAPKPGRAAPSLWADTAVAAPPSPTLDGAERADVAIIGAGFTGLSTAIHLAEAGVDVAVIEAESVGYGASGRNNGQVIPTLSRLDPAAMAARYPARGADGIAAGERLAALVRDSAGIVFDLVRRLGLDAEAEQTGWLQPVHTPGRMRLAETRWREWQAIGADIALLDREAMAKALGSPNYFGGIRMASGGHINPLSLAREMARALQGLGGRVFVQSPARGLTHGADGWRIEAGRGSLTAKHLIVATNAYTHDIAEPLRRSVVPVASWQMSTTPLDPQIAATIIPGREAASDTRGDLRFFRHTANGRLVAGGALIVPADGVGKLKAMIADRLVETFPQIGEVSFDHVWNGYIGMTPDFSPRLLELGPDAYGWTGCNGRGVALSIALGREFAALLRGEPRDRLALPFEPAAPIPLHAIAKTVAPLMLARFRFKDSREVAG
ncbi:FAD-binding oxidoreductase [Acuticoccus sp. M5D2P5]|uniref:NAD(P)/FAD-dependent oxidoreductase n=1 Tax=Acuticoccus kalidii TaxID=2910977 RepID=UPI001F2E33AF|nr:FAD-binding oxidoreductase [Acuticoccus kalidii]MCF3936703.1 FAD-binding oxidoreductase [Acuticoccus kalidii]